ncbi:hypothetical protein KGF54_001044 [Candida jiufengensis]|uniref:uncharacterized protein n=1 Tax=Candida jiufengensis TaxID=497108 RepID=UPI002224617A|nr:uncharacterized protein KGF54_001044 [Candida jiufengensis]KAI5956569.1 hypothetical protein KGF54_001044 [Candida jiufengensis]
MTNVKENVSITFRVFETVFAIILIGLSASNIERIDDNVTRITYTLVVNVLDILFFGYYGFFMPVAMNGESPTIVILLAELAFFTMYLASWGSYAANFPTCGDGNVNWGTTSKSTCQIYQATMAFSIFEWVLYAIDLPLFLIYSYAPEVARYGIFHCFRLSPFFWGAVFTNYPPTTRRRCLGLFWRKSDSAISSKQNTNTGNTSRPAGPHNAVETDNAGVLNVEDDVNDAGVVNSSETPKTQQESTVAV